MIFKSRKYIKKYHLKTIMTAKKFPTFELKGGTVMAIAGNEFVVIAADTQLTSKDRIPTSRQNKLFRLSPVAVLGSAGSWADTLAVVRLMRAAVADYERRLLRHMTIDAMAQVLSNSMYKRRYLPYKVTPILAGIDKKGQGAVFSYDSVGHCERVSYQVCGTANAIVLPVLDSQLGFKNQSLSTLTEALGLTEAVAIATNCLDIAGKLDVCTGGSVLMNIISKDGIEVRELPLRKN